MCLYTHSKVWLISHQLRDKDIDSKPNEIALENKYCASEPSARANISKREQTERFT